MGFKPTLFYAFLGMTAILGYRILYLNLLQSVYPLAAIITLLIIPILVFLLLLDLKRKTSLTPLTMLGYTLFFCLCTAFFVSGFKFLLASSDISILGLGVEPPNSSLFRSYWSYLKWYVPFSLLGWLVAFILFKSKKWI